MTDTIDFIKQHYVIIILILAVIAMVIYAFVTAPMMPDDYDEHYPLPPPIDYCDCEVQSISTTNLYRCGNCGKLIDPEE